MEQVSTSDRRRACASLGNDRCLEIARTSFLRRSQFSSEIVALHRAGMKFVALSWCKAPPFLAERQSYWAQRWIKRRSVGASGSTRTMGRTGVSGSPTAVGAPGGPAFPSTFPFSLTSEQQAQQVQQMQTQGPFRVPQFKPPTLQ